MVVAKKKCPCRGCNQDILSGEKCFDVPNPRSAFSSSRRFCCECFKIVIIKTKQDVANLEKF